MDVSLEIIAISISTLSLVVSGILAVLRYKDLNVQRSKKELMEAEQEPVVSYEKYEVEDDGIHVWLTNTGNSIAEQPRVRLEVQSQNGAVLRSAENDSPLCREEDEVWQSGDPLLPEQESAYYYGVPTVQFENKEGVRVTRRFSTMSEFLLENDVRQFDFRLSIVYRTQTGQQKELPLRALHSVGISDFCTLEEAIAKSRERPHDHVKWKSTQD